ncbi:hypothetical protein H0H92_006683 [Tricholoma furcatifolium]|nr:hypothetical protein H0H92_006683 [Tricholoma furcatifolium]
MGKFDKLKAKLFPCRSKAKRDPTLRHSKSLPSRPNVEHLNHPDYPTHNIDGTIYYPQWSERDPNDFSRPYHRQYPGAREPYQYKRPEKELPPLPPETLPRPKMRPLPLYQDVPEGIDPKDLLPPMDPTVKRFIDAWYEKDRRQEKSRVQRSTSTSTKPAPGTRDASVKPSNETSTFYKHPAKNQSTYAVNSLERYHGLASSRGRSANDVHGSSSAFYALPSAAKSSYNLTHYSGSHVRNYTVPPMHTFPETYPALLRHGLQDCGETGLVVKEGIQSKQWGSSKGAIGLGAARHAAMKGYQAEIQWI